MARPLRLELAGGVYHITSRGDRREDIYLNDDDRESWLEIFGEVCRRFNWRCHAYCLMSNHYHIVVETVEGNLAKGMRQLNGVYTQRFNRTHGRVGHVYQGRYKGIMVDKDNYLLELSRYVVLNPVRASMVKNAKQWPWSSYHAMIGSTPSQDWLMTDWILSQLSRQRKRAVQGYIDFVRAGVGLPPIWENLQQQIYLGDDTFVSRMQRRISKESRLGEIPTAQKRPKAKPLSDFAKRHKDSKKAMTSAYESGCYTMKEIADYFNVHYATVSRAVRLAEQAGNQSN